MPDWRFDNAHHTKGFVFAWRVYKQPRASWDHDHCVGCNAKFAEIDGPEILHEGYASNAQYLDRPGYYDWICDECFRDLKDTLGWILIG